MAGHSLANFNGMPFVVGGWQGGNVHNRTEMLEIENEDMKWVIQAEYPFFKG